MLLGMPREIAVVRLFVQYSVFNLWVWENIQTFRHVFRMHVVECPRSFR